MTVTLKKGEADKQAAPQPVSGDLSDTLSDPLTDPLKDPLASSAGTESKPSSSVPGVPDRPGAPDAPGSPGGVPAPDAPAPAPSSPAAPAAPSGLTIQGKSEAGQRFGEGGLDGLKSQALQGVSGGGGSLPHQAKMESYFGGPLDVSAHTGVQARESSEALGASAYTVGRDIAFGTSNPSPELVAHELTHVAQQARGVRFADGFGRTGDRYERQADAVAAGVNSGRPATDFLGGPFPARPGGAPPAIQRRGRPKNSKSYLSESNTGVYGRGKTSETLEHWRGDSTTELSGKGEALIGVRGAVEQITKVSGKTVQRAVQVMAIAGAFGDTAGEVVFKTGRLKLGASGSTSDYATARGHAKGTVQTVEKEIVVDGEVRVVIRAIKLLAEAGFELGTGFKRAGKLTAAYGALGTEAEATLDLFFGTAGSIGGTFSADWYNLAVGAALSANWKLGLQIDHTGGVKVTLGSWVGFKANYGVSFFAGVRASGSLTANVDLRKFFSLAVSTKPKTWKGGPEENKSEFGQDTKPEGQTVVTEGDTTHTANYGVDVLAKFEAMAGAEAKQTGKLGLNIKNVGIMDMTEDINALAGAKANAQARFGLSITELHASAKAEAFAGLQAKATATVSPISYKGRALFKAKGGAQVYLGAAASAGFTFSINPFGKIAFYGKAAAALGFGFGFEFGFELDLTVLLEAMKDFIVKMIVLFMNTNADRRRAQRGERYGRYLTRDPNAEPPDEPTQTHADEKVAEVYAVPFEEYENKTARSGWHKFKKTGLQRIIDDGAADDEELPTLLPTAAGDIALTKLAKKIFGGSGVVTAISFRGGNIDDFEIDQEAVKTQARVRPQFRKRLAKYKRKKAWVGRHGVKGDQVKYLINDVIIDVVYSEQGRPEPSVLKHEVTMAARDVLGRQVTLTWTEGDRPEVASVVLASRKEDTEEQTNDEKALKAKTRGKVEKRFRKFHEKRMKKGGEEGWIQKYEINELLEFKGLSKMIETEGESAWKNDVIVGEINKIADEVFGLPTGKITFKVQYDNVQVDQFPEWTEIRSETPAAVVRYKKSKAKKALLSHFATYAQKKSGKGSHWIKKAALQKKINKAKVHQWLGEQTHDDAVFEAIREAAKEKLGQEWVLKLRTRGAGKKKRVELYELYMVDEVLQGEAQFRESKQSYKKRVKDQVQPRFEAYAAKKIKKGKSWIKPKPVQKAIDKAKINRYLPINAGQGTATPRSTLLAYREAVLQGVRDAALVVFGARNKLQLSVIKRGSKIKLDTITTVDVPVGTEESALTGDQTEAIHATKLKSQAAVQPMFEKYAAKARKGRIGIVRAWEGHRNYLKQDKIQGIVDGSNVKKFLDPKAPSNPESLYNKAVIAGVTKAAYKAFGKGRAVFHFRLLGEEIWLRKIEHVRKSDDANIAESVTQTKELVKGAILPRFKTYAKKKTQVKHWHSFISIPYGRRSKHWIKPEKIDKLLAKADLGQFLDPWTPYSSDKPLNIAARDAVKGAADEAFPPDWVRVEFKLAAPSVKVKSFYMKDKGIKLKVGSQIHYHFSKYRDGIKYKWNMRWNKKPKIKDALATIVKKRVPADYKVSSAWRDAVLNVGRFVFKDVWDDVNPL